MTFYNGRHLLSAEDMDYHMLERILGDAQIVELMAHDPNGREELRKVLSADPNSMGGRDEPYKALIYSPMNSSLRTANGSLNAFRMLGGIADIYDGQFSPYMDQVAGPKDESLFSVARTAAAYRYDVLLIRNDRARREEDSFRILADKCDRLGLPFHIISMGEGDREHPLQMLADIATIKESKEELLRVGELKIGFIGDVACSRTFHSLAIGLANYGGEIYMISPRGNVFPKNIWEKVEQLNKEMVLLRGYPKSTYVAQRIIAEGKGKLVRHDTNNLLEVIEKLDACIWAQLQNNWIIKKNGSAGQMEAEYKAGFIVNERVLEKMPANAIGLHSLPHSGQFPEALDLDEDTRFIHWRGVEKGLYTKVAVFIHLLRGNYPLTQRWNEAKQRTAQTELQRFPRKKAI